MQAINYFDLSAQSKVKNPTVKHRHLSLYDKKAAVSFACFLLSWDLTCPAELTLHWLLLFPVRKESAVNLAQGNPSPPLNFSRHQRASWILAPFPLPCFCSLPQVSLLSTHCEAKSALFDVCSFVSGPRQWDGERMGVFQQPAWEVSMGKGKVG